MSEGNGSVAGVIGEFYFVVGEVAFGADEHYGVVGWAAGLGH